MEVPISGPLPRPRPFVFAEHYQHVVNWCVSHRISPTFLTPVDPQLHKIRGTRNGIYILCPPNPFSSISIDTNELIALLEMYGMRPAIEDDLVPLRQMTRR